MHDDEYDYDAYDYEEDEIIEFVDFTEETVEIGHSEDKIDMIIAPNNIILGDSSALPLEEMLRKIGFKPRRRNDYKGYLKGRNGKRYFGWLRHRWGEYYDLYVKGLDKRILDSPKGPCFIPRFFRWYKVDFERDNVPPITLIRETEYVLNRWG